MKSMQISYIPLLEGPYAFTFAVLLVLIITILVVWPAVWAHDQTRREAAYRVLDLTLGFILKFFRPGHRS
jgi:hypothetical protein